MTLEPDTFREVEPGLEPDGTYWRHQPEPPTRTVDGGFSTLEDIRRDIAAEESLR
jgi:hypothetical protein